MAEQVYSFLTENHVNVFLATKELRKLGDSEYREAIEDALESAEHLIVFASNPAYIKSKWVKYEWGLFLNAKIDGFKDGNIITILHDITPRDIAFALRRYESFPFAEFRDSLLSYVETDASRQRAEEAKRREENESKLRREEEERRRRIEGIKTELVQLAVDYKTASSGLDVIAAKIKSHKRAIGTEEYICPVCGAGNDLERDYCEECGWIFSPIEGIKGAEYLTADFTKASSIYKEIYDGGGRTSDNIHLIDELKQQQTQLEENNLQLKEQLKNISEDLIGMELAKDRLEQLIPMLNERLTAQEKRNNELTATSTAQEQKNVELSKKLKGVEVENSELSAKLMAQGKKNRELTEKLSTLERENKELKGNAAAQLERNKKDIEKRETQFNQTIAKKDTEIAKLEKRLKSLQSDTEIRVGGMIREITDLKRKLAEKLLSSGSASSKSTSGSAGSASSGSAAASDQDVEYAVWLTFSNKRVEDLVRSYNTSIGTFPIGKTNLYITSFPTLKKAEWFKTRLAQQGATAVIRVEVIDDSSEDKTGKTTNSGSTKTTSTGSVSASGRYSGTSSNPGVKISIGNFNDSLSTFGIVITHAGYNKSKVAQILSEVYEYSTTYFHNFLIYLPNKTKAYLSRQQADVLLSRLKYAGATAELYQL